MLSGQIIMKTRYFRNTFPFLSVKLHGETTLNQIILKYLKPFVTELQPSHSTRPVRANGGFKTAITR